MMMHWALHGMRRIVFDKALRVDLRLYIMLVTCTPRKICWMAPFVQHAIKAQHAVTRLYNMVNVM